jgi:fumarate hydratase, class II
MENRLEGYRIERDSMGEVRVPADKLWGAQTQRSLEHFSIGRDIMPPEMITAYACIKKACAIVNCRSGRLAVDKKDLIVTVCNELLDHQHRDMFPLHVWMTGSGTQFNMNINEVIANRCSQLAGMQPGSQKPVHPIDDVNMSQSSNDSFPTAMNIAAASGIKYQLLPAIRALREGLSEKAEQWETIVKIGRTHLQDATPLTLGQEFSGYVRMLDDNTTRIEQALDDVYKLALGGTAVGTGMNTPPRYSEGVAEEIASLTGLPFVTAPNKFAVQGSHDALVSLSASLKTLAVSLYKISNDIRLLSSGPRAGISEIILPANEPGSSMMPGKINPTQCEAMAMVSVQVMANDMAVAMAGAGGHLEMNVYKPLIIYNITRSIGILSDSMHAFLNYTVKGMRADEEKIDGYVTQSLMLVTALVPVIGYDKAAQVIGYAVSNNLSPRQAAVALGYISGEEYDRLVVPEQMTRPDIR